MPGMDPSGALAEGRAWRLQGLLYAFAFAFLFVFTSNTAAAALRGQHISFLLPYYFLFSPLSVCSLSPVVCVLDLSSTHACFISCDLY